MREDAGAVPAGRVQASIRVVSNGTGVVPLLRSLLAAAASSCATALFGATTRIELDGVEMCCVEATALSVDTAEN